MSSYDTVFFDYVNSGAMRSAERALPHLTKHMTINSVLDVGCGQGAWLSVWRKLGAIDIQGIDGDYVDRSRLLIDEEFFNALDLEGGFDLGRRFDLVQTLEVAEHLPGTSAARFVESLAQHGDIILFSAAPKGQGGDHHVNEQDYDYWRKLFMQRGYIAFDYLRPLLRGNSQIEPWYRYNIFLYVSKNRIQDLPECIRSTQVEDVGPLPDISPLLYRLRKLLIRMLPVDFVTWLSKLRQRWIIHVRGVGR